MCDILSPQYPGKKQFKLDDYPEVPAQVRVILWLGLEKHQEAWTNRHDIEGDFCVFAETVGFYMTAELDV